MGCETGLSIDRRSKSPAIALRKPDEGRWLERAPRDEAPDYRGASYITAGHEHSEVRGANMLGDQGGNDSVRKLFGGFQNLPASARYLVSRQRHFEPLPLPRVAASAFTGAEPVHFEHGRSRGLIHEGANAVGAHQGAATDFHDLEFSVADKLIQLRTSKTCYSLGIRDRDGEGFHIAVLQ